MNLLIYLESDNHTFCFQEEHLLFLKKQLPDVKITWVQSKASFLEELPKATDVFCWVFSAKYYDLAKSLKKIWTPAAGHDWIALPPTGSEVSVQHGCFHGKMIAEGFLGFLLYFQNQLGQAQNKQKEKQWDRNFQKKRRLLSQQKLLILGAGNIAGYCANGAKALGLKVDLLRRSPAKGELSWKTVDLSLYDHILNLIPASPENDALINQQLFEQMKKGVFFYNFGRGTTVSEKDLKIALDKGIVAGAGLDVTYTEPLPQDSFLWQQANVLITPHSSCIYTDYHYLFLEEFIGA